jgi:uncharacterized protein
VKILFFSDVHADFKALERLLAVEADAYFCAGDLASSPRSLQRAGEMMRHLAGRMMVIPGNHESEQDIEVFCQHFGFEAMHGKSKSVGNFQLAALGYSNLTPFNTPGEYTEAELEKRLEPFVALPHLLMVCHCPPKSTPLDRAGEGKHFGSTAVAAFLAKAEPRYFFCGHIHEAEGVSCLLGQHQQTTALNVGKRGYLLDLAKL